MLFDPTPFAVVAHHCARVVYTGGNQRVHSDAWIFGTGGGGLAAVTALGRWWWYKRHPPDDSGGDGDSGGNGGSGGPPPDPQPPDPQPDGPSWWPDFEREFAAYVEREKESVRVARGRGSPNA